MKYRFYIAKLKDGILTQHTIATRSGSNPVSTIARALADHAFKQFGPSGYRLVHDQTLVGGYYEATNGDTLAVETDWETGTFQPHPMSGHYGPDGVGR